MQIRGIAHRGYPTKYPENTIAAFQAALNLRYTHVELDVHLSKDGVPVVIHDTTLNRVSDGTGPVQAHTLEELKRIRVGGTESIPTLDETLRLFKGRMTVFLELKQVGHRYEGIEEKVLEVIHRLDMREQMIMTSFDHYSLMKIRELDPAIHIGLILGCLSPCVFPFMEQLGSKYLWMSHKYLTADYVRDCEARGIQVIANPIDSDEVRRKVLKRFPSALVSTNELEAWRDFYLEHQDELQGVVQIGV